MSPQYTHLYVGYNPMILRSPLILETSIPRMFKGFLQAGRSHEFIVTGSV